MSIDNTKLKEQFPMLRTRMEVLDVIRQVPELETSFRSMPEELQEDFLDMVTGVRGTKVMYDFMFRQIMDPDAAPERLESFLFSLLGRPVRIVAKLKDKETFADESSLLETDIVVSFDDGSIANVEIQKVGIAFPGERSACYSADLLLRQYRKVRGDKARMNRERKKRVPFSYRDLRPVYTIVLFEESPKVFKAYPDRYIHRFEQRSDSGIKLELLQKYIFIPLDIFAGIYENIGIQSELDAWLVFFSQDSPEAVMDLIERFPKFREYYNHVYTICLDVENVMGLFSKELRILDRNTVKIMIDELQEENERLKAENEKVKEEVRAELEEKEAEIRRLKQLLQQKNEEMLS